MTDEESASLGDVMQKIYRALRLHTGAERVYQVTLIEGVPHFHSWLVPHRKDDPEKGMKFLMRDDSCSEEEASALADKLRASM
jgi:diadenosine tetraphosphate (Ap4A) HIT family hydrolase